MSTRYRNGANPAGRVVAIVADVAALILGLWILMYLLEANRANDLVRFVHDAASWLAGWSYDLFTSTRPGPAWSPGTAWPPWSICSPATR